MNKKSAFKYVIFITYKDHKIVIVNKINKIFIND